MKPRNPYEAAGRAEKVARMVPFILRSLNKFAAGEVTSQNVGGILRNLAPEVWRDTAIRAGVVRPPSQDTINAIVLAIEVVYEDTEERDTQLDYDTRDFAGFAPHDIAPVSGVVWH
jgi:hypothetical protein